MLFALATGVFQQMAPPSPYRLGMPLGYFQAMLLGIPAVLVGLILLWWWKRRRMYGINPEYA